MFIKIFEWNNVLKSGHSEHPLPFSIKQNWKKEKALQNASKLKIKHKKGFRKTMQQEINLSFTLNYSPR